MNHDISYSFSRAVWLLCAVTVLLLAGDIATVFSDELKSAPLQADKESLAKGKRMYMEGILPSGEPMQAYIKGDISVPGNSFTCVSCHMRSGLGSYEGGVYTTPTNGKTLYSARGIPGVPERNMAMTKNGAKVEYTPPRPPPARPPYTDETLAAALRGGIDPIGRVLNDAVMPRYNLSDGDMEHLIAYLKNLSNDFSPGVDGTYMRLATIVSEDVPAAEIDAMLTPMKNFVENMNNLEKTYRQNARKLRVSFDKMPFRRLQLLQWKLKGSPETWQKQLEEYYRKEPVFALVGGIVQGEWKPIHDFSESNQIPSILPTTDFPAVSETDWYTLYLSKGLFQEGASAARYLNGLEKIADSSKIVQIVRSSREGQALSSGFLKTWHELGHAALPHTITLKSGERLTAEYLRTVLSKHRPAALMLWTGPEDVALLDDIALSAKSPQAVFVSWGYLGKSTRLIKDLARPITYITYPYRMPQDEAKFATDIERLKSLNNVQDAQLLILIKTYYALGVLSQAIKDIADNYYRDYLLDVISMQSDVESPLYERVSFGPDQRYASKGCYVVQLSEGSKLEFIKKSDWVQH